MSHWRIRRSAGAGSRTEITSIPFIELALFGAMFGLPLILLMAAPLAFGPPRIAGVVIYGLLGTGLLLFVIAKVSVIRAGHLISFGSSTMSTSMRWCYRLGYALCGLGVVLAFGTLRWWAAA